MHVSSRATSSTTKHPEGAPTTTFIRVFFYCCLAICYFFTVASSFLSLPSHTRTPYQRPQLSLLECVCLVPDSVQSSPSDIQCRRHRRFVAVVLPLTSSSAILVLLSIHPVCVYRFPFSRIAQWQSGGVIIIYIYLRMTTMYTPACANVDKKDPRSVDSIGKVGALLLVVVGGKVGRSAPCLADLSIFLRSLPYPHSPRVRSASHSCKKFY